MKRRKWLLGFALASQMAAASSLTLHEASDRIREVRTPSVYPPIGDALLVGRYARPQIAPHGQMMVSDRLCDFWWDESGKRLLSRWTIPLGNGQVVVRDGVVAVQERQHPKGEIVQISIHVTRAVQSIGDGKVKPLARTSYRFRVVRSGGSLELISIGPAPEEFAGEGLRLWRVGYPR